MFGTQDQSLHYKDHPTDFPPVDRKFSAAPSVVESQDHHHQRKAVPPVAAMSATPASLHKFQQNLRLHNQLKEQLKKQLMERSYSNGTSLQRSITNVSVTKTSACIIQSAPMHTGRPREYTPQKHTPQKHTVHWHSDETNKNFDPPAQHQKKNEAAPNLHSATSRTSNVRSSLYNNSYSYSYLTPEVHRPVGVSDVEYARAIMASYSRNHPSLPFIQSHHAYTTSNVELNEHRLVEGSNVEYAPSGMDIHSRHQASSFPLPQVHSVHTMSDVEYAHINNRTWHQPTSNITQQQNTNHEESYSCNEFLPYALNIDREPNNQGIEPSPDSHWDPFDCDSDDTETSSETTELNDERNRTEGMDDSAKSDDGYFSHSSVSINDGPTNACLLSTANTNGSGSKQYEIIDISSDTETKDNEEDKIQRRIWNTNSSNEQQYPNPRKRSFMDAFLSPDARDVSGHDPCTENQAPRYSRDADMRTGMLTNKWNSSPASNERSNTHLFFVEPVLFGNTCSNNDAPATRNTDSPSKRSPNRRGLYRVPSHHSPTFGIQEFQSYFSCNMMEERLIEPIVITPSDENGNPLKDDSYW